MSQTNADNDVIWADVNLLITSFFDRESQISVHRNRNKILKYNFGHDPQSYVSCKIEVLALIDSGMSETNKVRHLRQELPYPIKNSVAPLRIMNSDEYIDTLRRTVENIRDYSNESRRESSASSRSSNPPSTFMGKTQDENPGTSNTRRFYNNSAPTPRPPQPQFDGQPRFGANNRTADGAPRCDHCGYVRHVKKYCRQLQAGRPAYYARAAPPANNYANLQFRNNPYNPQGYAQQNVAAPPAAAPNANNFVRPPFNPAAQAYNANPAAQAYNANASPSQPASAPNAQPSGNFRN